MRACTGAAECKGVDCTQQHCLVVTAATETSFINCITFCIYKLYYILTQHITV